MSDSPTPDTPASFRWAPWWVIAFVATWPGRGVAAGILVLGALVACGLLIRQRFRGGSRYLSHEAWALTSVLFLAYWLPEAFSLLGAVDPRETAENVVGHLVYLPALWLAAMAVADARGRRIAFNGIAAVVGIWTLDALVQAVTGWSLGGHLPGEVDRINGIFGADGNFKLGIVIASLAPFPLAAAARRLGTAGWVLAAGAMFVVVLLAGSRASWLTYALVLAVSGWVLLGLKRALLVLVLGAGVVGGLAVSVSDRLMARMERTEAALSGEEEGVDHALSGRLAIWTVAGRMALDHPLTGVGVRGFRCAYPDYAEPGDQFLREGGGSRCDGRPYGAFHAHQIVLEILSETGLAGMVLWLFGVALALRAWFVASTAARLRAAVPGLALAVTVFPLNTHLATYSTFWGGVTLLLAALFAGTLLARDAPRAAVRPGA
ncbi:O-antigen ligase family protein [Coralloluteibacterium stylophorae]|uniref:O-antigen ligase family protein n=1 Tax=Coralloluteibacterium stylophorae TaxID=1776034 RepID=A0A8J7VUV9_9GAMM|nr:O-antigen ligase family protein [Coralloluteibacterium stylophorae]MBS7458498.1 O-antigen ligase family protein [Coralloluteibacterium stylophorae]